MSKQRDRGLYWFWMNMMRRCYKQSTDSYYLYGGRGIGVSDKWRAFENFNRDMKSSYQKGLSLDRIRNDEGYSPENCRWVTMKQQQNNRRNNVFFKYKGIADTLTNWSEYLGIKKSTLDMRVYKYGWDVGEALSTPTNGKRGVDFV